jgi:Chloroplast envelope transporter
MGLKDMLFGKKEDANKVAYRDEVKKAVADGKLTPEKVKHLEKLKNELDVGAAAQDFTMVRREQYQTAADAMMAQGKLSEAEEKELQRVQAFLGLKDQQIAQTKVELGRLRMLTDMRAGKFPEISSANVLMRGLKLAEGEVAHWGEIAIMLEGEDTGGSVGAGLKLMPNMAYQPGSVGTSMVPLKGATPMDEGHLIMTSLRLIMKGQTKVTAFTYDKPEEINLYKDGVRLRLGKGRAVLFKFRSLESADFIGLLMAKGLNPKKFGPGGDATQSLDFV